MLNDLLAKKDKMLNKNRVKSSLKSTKLKGSKHIIEIIVIVAELKRESNVLTEGKSCKLGYSIEHKTSKGIVLEFDV